MSTIYPALFMILLSFSTARQEDLHYIGVGYNLLTGNPDGSLVSNGGVDPGLLYTRKIFEVTEHDSPKRVQIEHRHSCANKNTTSMYYGTKSYQDKLKLGVKTSGGASVGLASFSFTLSGRYQQAHNKTNLEHNIIQDQQNLCNLGRVRYMTELAHAGKFPITQSFAAAICSLPVTYNQSTYMNFLDQWGTHITIEVELGKKQISRSQSSFKQFVEQVRKSGDFDLDVGGSYLGFSASLGINFDTFKQSSSFNQNYGTYQYTLQSGSETLPEPISLKLQTIDEALQPVFWQRFDDLIAAGICSADDQIRLQLRRSHLIRSLEDYAAYKMAPTPTDPKLIIPVTWPKGTYGLMMTTSRCPSEHSFSWHTGYVIQDTEDFHNHNSWSSDIHVSGEKDDKRIAQVFCIKGSTQVSEFDMNWPKGDYCILKYGSCPDGFSYGSIGWDDEDPGDRNQQHGTLPDGRFDSNTKIDYCCRSDGLPTEEIVLPKDKPFILLRHKRGCQEVVGMNVREETISWDTEDVHNQDIRSGDHPYEDGGENIRLHFCYYSPKTSVTSVVG
ncbi:uncharacterized protein LOC133197381 [Saccostrea echinata]|uniref:uncharacterized protein LOC133197381 n=1 Tax=Saccostrea echinata TaxID=191078 RepID=UPI002A819D64|nr:uncharacterized protein LOC133197381 [Saccostrea echinata]XP_061189369.1 uncharacterized protein LOC133197381 [Saccostrea echinata]